MSSPAELRPDDVAGSLGRNDGGFGRDQSMYYDHPILQRPHWGWEIEWYFYVGGLASGSALLAWLGSRSGDDPALVRQGRYIAVAGAAVSGVLLIKDLGRPERFLNMMRIVKLKSPMSVGVYALSGFSALAGAAAADQAYLDRLLPIDVARLVPAPLRDALLAPFAALLGSYTGVLLSATAIPIWYTGRRHIPAIFVCSATSTACALNVALLALQPGDHERTIHKLERLELFASACEWLLLRDYRRAAGTTIGRALFDGEIGKQLEAQTLRAGIAAPFALNLAGRAGIARGGAAGRVRMLVAAGLTLAGGLMLRKAVVRAGKVSADDTRAYLQPR